MQSTLLSVLALAGTALGHGRVTSPPARAVGDAFKAACGETMFNTEKSDPNGNIQGLQQQAGSAYDPAKCPLELCKGIPFADNSANVQTFTLGQTIDFKVAIVAPHTGVANVSVLDASTNTMIGSPLISFTNYASTKTGVAANNTAFSVTLPDSLPDTCGTAGGCVLQWWWDSPTEAKQTYISCVDFAVGGISGGGGGGGNGGGSTTTTKAPAATTTAASSTSTSTTTPTATPTSTPGSGNGGTTPSLPANFTLNQFITWLTDVAGSGAAAKFRRHARDLMMAR